MTFNSEDGKITLKDENNYQLDKKSGQYKADKKSFSFKAKDDMGRTYCGEVIVDSANGGGQFSLDGGGFENIDAKTMDEMREFLEL